MINKKGVFLRAVTLLGILIQLCLGSIVAYAGTTSTGFVYYSMGNVMWITGYTGNQSDIQIPESINGKPVTVISARSFYNNKVIKSVEIPSTITSIQTQAFAKCTNLTDINIPSSVTEIKTMTFQGCTSLKYIELPNSVQRIEDSAFKDCIDLKSIDIPEAVTAIEDYTFYGCSQLDTVILPNSIVTIGREVFRNCKKLKQINLPNGISSIGSGTFDNCTSLLGVKLPENLMLIESSLFRGCTSIIAVNIPEKVKEIKTDAFYECSQLQAINIPQNVTIIGSMCFYKCADSLKIYGSTGSYASTYATKNKIKFIGQQRDTNVTLNLKDIKNDTEQWEIVATVKGEGEKSSTDVKLMLNIPSSLQLIDGSVEVNIGKIEPGEEKQISWLVKQVSNEKQAYGVVMLSGSNEAIIEINKLS